MGNSEGMRAACAGMLALAVAMGIGRFAYTPLLPAMQHDYGLPLALGTWLATANYVGYLAGALSAMAISVYPATAIGGGLLAIALVTLGMGLTHDYHAWIALRAIAGIASAWVMIYTASWCLERLAMLRMPSLNGRIFAGVGLGIMVTGLFSLYMMSSRWSAATAWWTLGIVSLIVVLVITPTFTRSAVAIPRVKTTMLERRRWDNAAIRMIACFATSGYGYIVPATFLPAMAKQLIDEPAIFGWAWPVFGAAALASTLAAGAIRGRISNRGVWIASQLVMAAGVALPAIWHDIAAIILAGLLVGGTFMVISMAAIQEARSIAGPNAVGLVSALTAAFAIGQILGPLSVSLLIELGGGLAAALLIASCTLVAGSYVLYRTPASAGRGLGAPDVLRCR